jgi:hypothetical protein
MLNVSESGNVNKLLDWILGPESALYGRPRPTDDEARQAACELAEAANKRLSAGRNGSRTAADWDNVGPVVEHLADREAA